MSSIGDAIFQIAKEVAGLARDETQSYQKKIDEAKQHLDELTARLKLAREAPHVWIASTSKLVAIISVHIVG